MPILRASLCQRLFSLRLPCKVAGLYATGVAAKRIISLTNFISPEIIIRFQPVNSNSKAKATKVERAIVLTPRRKETSQPAFE